MRRRLDQRFEALTMQFLGDQAVENTAELPREGWLVRNQHLTFGEALEVLCIRVLAKSLDDLAGVLRRARAQALEQFTQEIAA